MSNPSSIPEFQVFSLSMESPVHQVLNEFPICNHVVAPMNNNAMILAKQMGLATTTEEEPVLFQRTAEGTVRMLPDDFKRIQYAINRLFYKKMKGISGLESDPDSIQELIDTELAAMILELERPADSPFNLRLVEYCYACLEARITELLLSVQDESGPKTACLSKLSPSDLRGFIISKAPNQYIDVLKAISFQYDPQEFKEPRAYSKLIEGLRIPDNSLNSDFCIVGYPEIYTLKRGGTELRKADSVIVTVPTSRINVIFCDNPTEEALKTQQKGIDSQELESVNLFLPHFLRVPSPEGENKRRSQPSSEASDSTAPIYVTVTLMYEEPWWRPLLHIAGTIDKMSTSYQSIDLDEFPLPFKQTPMRFAFLPKDRKSRGSYHVFRDLSAPNSQCGIIQTSIIGKELEESWVNSDQMCVNYVDKYIKHCLATNARKTGEILEFHVGRLYLPSSSSGEKADSASPSSPSFVVRSANPDLLDVSRAVRIHPDDPDGVYLCNSPFVMDESWWRMLSQQYSIHVLQALGNTCQINKPVQDEMIPLDVLSRETNVGLKWASYVTGFLFAKNSPNESEVLLDPIDLELSPSSKPQARPHSPDLSEFAGKRPRNENEECAEMSPLPSTLMPTDDKEPRLAEAKESELQHKEAQSSLNQPKGESDRLIAEHQSEKTRQLVLRLSSVEKEAP